MVIQLKYGRLTRHRIDIAYGLNIGQRVCTFIRTVYRVIIRDDNVRQDNLPVRIGRPVKSVSATGDLHGVVTSAAVDGVIT